MLKSELSWRGALCEARYAAIRRWRAVGGRSVERSVPLFFSEEALRAVVVVVVVELALPCVCVCVCVRARWIPGSRTLSSWKYARAAISNLLNSRALCVPAATGAVKRGQSDAQHWIRRGRVRAAGRVKESWTAAVKRVHRSVVSCCVVLGREAGGVRVRIAMYCAFVYGGKWMCGGEEIRRRDGEGVVMMNMVVRFGIYGARNLVSWSF